MSIDQCSFIYRTVELVQLHQHWNERFYPQHLLDWQMPVLTEKFYELKSKNEKHGQRFECNLEQTWFLKRKIAVWIDMYIIFSANATLQKAYARNTGFLKSINWYAKAIFAIHKWNLPMEFEHGKKSVLD